MNGLTRRSMLATMGAALATPALVRRAHAAEVTLRLHHFLPAMAPIQKALFEPWAAEIAEASQGRIEIQMFPAMQLGGKPPQLADQVRKGICDIAWTLPVYTPDRFLVGETNTRSRRALENIGAKLTDRREDRIGVRRLDQGEISILGEGVVSGIGLAERELQNVAIVGLLDASLRDDAEETGLRDGTFDGSEIGSGETGETHTRGENGVLEHEVTHDGDSITVGGRSIRVFEERDPAALPWGDLGVDIAALEVEADDEGTANGIAAQIQEFLKG